MGTVCSRSGEDMKKFETGDKGWLPNIVNALNAIELSALKLLSL